MFKYCKNCGSWMRSPAHKCEIYEIRYNDMTYRVYGEFPEHAIENLSAHVNKEIYCEIGRTEYYTEKVGERYNAYIIFERDNVEK